MTNPSKPVSITEAAFCDLHRELAQTRKLLERMPTEHFSFRPHEKSMNFGRLAMHTVNLVQWMCDTLLKDELDMAIASPQREEPKDQDDLLRTFDQNVIKLQEALARADDSALMRPWTLCNGQQVLHTQPRIEILRIWCLNHLIHHRAQLCIYLRLLNLPVPTIYFNSADEPEWVFR